MRGREAMGGWLPWKLKQSMSNKEGGGGPPWLVSFWFILPVWGLQRFLEPRQCNRSWAVIIILASKRAFQGLSSSLPHQSCSFLNTTAWSFQEEEQAGFFSISQDLRLCTRICSLVLTCYMGTGAALLPQAKTRVQERPTTGLEMGWW